MKILNYNLDQIKDLIVDGADTLVITSPSSTSENSISKQLGSVSDSNWRISLARANANTNIDSLCHDIVRQALPNKAEDTAPIVAQVHQYLEHSAHNGIIPVIFIEDANELSLESLRFVLQLSALRYVESQFRIVLFADESINNRLDDPELEYSTTGVLRNIHIPPASISIEETKTHIINDHQPLSTEIDEDLFTEPDIEEKSETGSSKSVRGLFFIIIGLVSASAIYFYFASQKGEGTTESDTTVSKQLPEAISGKNASQIDSSTSQEQEITIEEDDLILEDSNEILTQDTLIVDTPLSPNEPEIKIKETTPYEELPEYSEKIEHPVIEDIEEELIPEADDENVFNLESVPEYLSGIKGPRWLRQQSSDAYLLQLISAQYEENLKKLLSGQSSIQDQLSGYVKYTPSGKPRYVLLYGIYPNKKAAQAAIDDLPKEFQAIPPWPRAIDDVIKEVDGVSASFIEIEEGITIPLGEFSGKIEKTESPVIKAAEKESIPETDDENVFNLETVPEYLSSIKGPQWLRQQSSDAYLLQLISAQYEENLKKLLSGQSSIQDQLSGYVKYTPSGKPRYVLLYGIYPNKKAAQAAIDDLPKELQAIPPWPRSIDDVIRVLDGVSEPSSDEAPTEALSGFG